MEPDNDGGPTVEPPPPKEPPKPSPPKPSQRTAPVGEEPSEKKSPADKKKMTVVISLVASLAVTSVLLSMAKSRYFAKRSETEAAAKRREETAKKTDEKAVPPPVPAPPLEKPAQIFNFTMAPFIFQYRKNGEDRFIRLGLTFQMSNEDALAEARENTPLLRRSVAFYMKTRDVKELLSERTRRKILEEIRGSIDKSLKDGRATAVFVDEFVVY